MINNSIRKQMPDLSINLEQKYDMVQLFEIGVYT
jgi:hypothetical protein